LKKTYPLTQTQFEYIVEQCDAVLTKHRAEFAIAGIAWLNVLHSHPSIQSRYVHVFHKRNTGELISAIIRGTGVLVTNIISSFISIFKKTAAYKNIPTETDVLFISHLLNTTTPKNAPDFYFQDLPAYLQKKNYHTAIGLMNHVKGFTGWKTDNALSTKQPVKFLLPAQLDFGAELALIRRSIKTAFIFFKQYLKEKDALKKSFLLELTGNTLSAHTLRAYRLYEMVKYLAEHTNIKVIALTWEGHSWERMVCNAAKTAGRKITSIGYQHTILFPSSHALKKSVGSAFDPDIILTVGTVTRDILKASPDLQHVIIKEYGSPRLTGKQNDAVNKQIQNGCLVAPEGLVNECLILFTFAIEAARLLPGTDFIFRTHPSISFQALQAENDRLQNLPPNIIISSNKNIDDDFKRCSWLLYRNSSVSFFAILAGLRPIYLGVENEISNDVLYALNSWRLHVSIPEEMIAIIEKDKQASEDERNTEREQAYRFSQAYMMPYDVAIFENCISGKLIHG
jgi:hypothetical protein